MNYKRNHIDLSFEMEIYDGNREEDILVTVDCTGYVGTTSAMGDDPTDFYGWRVVGYTMDDIEIGDITASLTKEQWEYLEEKAFEELSDYNY